MKKTCAVLFIAVSLVACGGEGASAVDEDQDAGISNNSKTTTKASNGNIKDHKWEFAIEGLPDRSGRLITAVTAGINGRYSLSRSGFTASIEVQENHPNSSMMFFYDKENTRCFNKKSAMVTIDGDQAVVSGQVQCKPSDGGEQRTAGIEGWFVLDN